MHAFDKTDTTIIEVVKDNIISVLATMSYQDAMENIIRVDKFTGLYSAEYLYSKAKKTFDKYPTSAVCMFKIVNLEKINQECSREIGNQIVAEVSNIVKAKVPAQYVFVRYMGPKFVIVFSGVEEGSVEEFLKELKAEIEGVQVVEEAEEKPVVKTLNGKKVKVRELFEEKVASPKLNFVVSTYYKGTGLEQLNKKLEEYIDSVDSNVSTINYI